MVLHTSTLYQLIRRTVAGVHHHKTFVLSFFFVFSFVTASTSLISPSVILLSVQQPQPVFPKPLSFSLRLRELVRGVHHKGLYP